MSGAGFNEASLLDLFRVETQNQAKVLTEGLLALEREPGNPAPLEACMRAAHSLKGAARIVERADAATVANAMEDCFVSAQEGRIALHPAQFDVLLRGIDLLAEIARLDDAEVAAWRDSHGAVLEAFLADLAAALAAAPDQPAPVIPPPPAPSGTRGPDDGPADGRVLRVTADNLNRLLGLAGESLVEATWIKPFSQSLLRLKRLHHELVRDLDLVRDALDASESGEGARIAHADARRRALECAEQLAQRMAELESFDRRSSSLAQRLYGEAVAVRMRPFADGVDGFGRMVRDVARSLGKDVRLEIVGGATEVDRDILEQLESPLIHLLRNAVDHGIESPAARAEAGKPAQGVVRVEARHHAGRLQIAVSDDGAGIDAARLKTRIVERKLTNEETVSRLSEPELLAFLFLPGFSLRGEVTEISGRGVGLDVVQSMLKSVRGTVRVSTQPGRGTTFRLQLPLTLSILRALLVEVAGDSYALPLAAVVRTMKVPRSELRSIEGREYFSAGSRDIAVLAAQTVLAVTGPAPASADAIPVVMLGEGTRPYAIAVDRFVGERELVVQRLDPRLGKVKDVAAGALLEDGRPTLILDVDDLVRSIEKLLAAGPTAPVERKAADSDRRRRKRVLIVDDSLTVRELERKLLTARGYAVDVAVDGMDGWNAVRSHAFDLVVTDIDMPRLDGFELVRLIKRDPRLKAIPVMIVSYKDREADRQRGLDAGADYYLPKGSFHDETLLQAVVDLVGEAGP